MNYLTHDQIRARVTAIYSEMENLLDPATFVLNERINELNRELHDVQMQCKHEVVNHGKCAYCDLLVFPEDE